VTKQLLLLLCVLASAGCATTPDQTAEPREERAYRTGSNLPVREGSVSPDVKTVDPSSINLPAGRNARPQ
jgi:hypothetical protein